MSELFEWSIRRASTKLRHRLITSYIAVFANLAQLSLYSSSNRWASSKAGVLLDGVDAKQPSRSTLIAGSPSVLKFAFIESALKVSGSGLLARTSQITTPRLFRSANVQKLLSNLQRSV